MIRLSHFRILFFLLFLTQYSRGQTIDPTVKHQKVEGWGVSLAWWANLAGGMSQNAQNTLANYAVNDLNYNIFRFNIGGGENPNCTAGDHIRKDGGKMPGYRNQQSDNQGLGTYNLASDARQIAMMNKIAALRAVKGDIITETISYSPPWWMTYGLCSAGNVSATTENLRPEFYDDFADYLVSVTKGLKTTYPSWNISSIEPFNEPMSGYWQKGGGQEGSAFYPTAQGSILSFLKNKLQSYGLSGVSLTAADNTSVAQELSNMSSLLNNNPNEYNSLSKICVHSYTGNWQDKANLAAFAAQNGNKPIWQSETGPLGWNLPVGAPDWWVRHYDMAYRLIEDMRNLKASVWCDWQLMSTDDGWGMIQQTNWDENNPYQEPILKKTRGFYCRKNVTNFIKKGYQIIESNGSNTLAALNPTNTELVIVAVNNSGTSNSYNLDLRRFSGITGFKTYRTSGGDNSSENTTEKTIASVTEKGVLANNFLSYTAPAYSVTTFVIDISGTFVSIAPKSVAAPITPGVYYIKAKHSGKYMSVAGISSTDGAVVEQWEKTTQDNLKFELTIDANGYYQFKPVYNTKVVTVDGASISNGTAVNIYSNQSAVNQKFELIPRGEGFYQISPQHTYDKALAVTGNSVDNGADVILWDYIDANDNFKWAFEPVNVEKPLAPGTYYISAKHSGKYMSVAGVSSTDGAVIEQWEKTTQDNLKFDLSVDADGYYQFKPVYNTKVVTVNGASTVNGSPVNIYTNSNALNQKFRLEPVGNGHYRITPKYASAKALAVIDNSIDNGADVVSWDYNAANDNFKWAFEPVNVEKPVAPGTYYIKAKHSGKCMSVVGASTVNGAVIEQWEKINQDNLKFELSIDSDGYYQFKPVYTTKVVTVNGASTINGSAVNIYTDSSMLNQKFRLEPVGNEYYRITPKYASAKALAVTDNSMDNGTDVILWDYIAANDNFKWSFEIANIEKPIAVGTYYIKAKHSGKYMSVAGVSSTDGAVVEQWDKINQDNLKFNLSIDTEGYYQFRPVYNNKVVTVNGASTVNGSPINIYTNSNAVNQKFRLEPVGNGYYRITPKYASAKALAVIDNSIDNGADVVSWDYNAANDNFKWSFEVLPEDIDLFILAGQSNAMGATGDAALYPTDSIDNSIRLNYVLYQNSSSDGQWINMQPQQGVFPAGYFGPEVTFSRKLKENGYNPAIFKFTLGGTSLYGNWLAPGQGGMYDAMVVEYKKVVQKLRDQGHTVTVRGFVWIQGESDATAPQHTLYQARLTNLINDFRVNVVKNPCLPVVLGVDEQFPSSVMGTIVQAHKDIDASDNRIIFTSMLGLQKADYTHLAPSGLILHGQRIFDGYKTIVPNVNSSLNCLTPITPGKYYIGVKHSGKYMSVEGGSSTDGAMIEQWDRLNQDNLKFDLSIDLDGCYQIKPIYNDKVVTINGTSNSNGSSVSINTNLNALNQKFRIDTVGNGYFRITPKYAFSKALAVTGNSIDNGADVVLWDYIAANDNFKWMFTSTTNTLALRTSTDQAYTENLNPIQIYPNPSEGSFTIIKNIKGVLNLRFFDIIGNLMFESELKDDKTDIDLNKQKFQAGMYFLKALDGLNVVDTKKIIIK